MTDPVICLERFYRSLALLPSAKLGEIRGRHLPERGVYFFFEDGELRSDGSPRVVRVGTHAISAGSKATLRSRLRQHIGSASGVGNHRGSVFRLLIGLAIIERDSLRPSAATEHWAKGSSAPKSILELETEIERSVSSVLRDMRVAWLEAEDEPSPQSVRRRIERGSIRLLATIGSAIDPPSPNWLGRYCPKEAVGRSGMWNIRETETGPLDFELPDVIDTLGTRRQF